MSKLIKKEIYGKLDGLAFVLYRFALKQIEIFNKRKIKFLKKSYILGNTKIDIQITPTIDFLRVSKIENYGKWITTIGRFMSEWGITYCKFLTFDINEEKDTNIYTIKLKDYIELVDSLNNYRKATHSKISYNEPYHYSLATILYTPDFKFTTIGEFTSTIIYPIADDYHYNPPKFDFLKESDRYFIGSKFFVNSGWAGDEEGFNKLLPAFELNYMFILRVLESEIESYALGKNLDGYEIITVKDVSAGGEILDEKWFAVIGLTAQCKSIRDKFKIPGSSVNYWSGDIQTAMEIGNTSIYPDAREGTTDSDLVSDRIIGLTGLTYKPAILQHNIDVYLMNIIFNLATIGHKFLIFEYFKPFISYGGIPAIITNTTSNIYTNDVGVLHEYKASVGAKWIIPINAQESLIADLQYQINDYVNQTFYEIKKDCHADIDNVEKYLFEYIEENFPFLDDYSLSLIMNRASLLLDTSRRVLNERGWELKNLFLIIHKSGFIRRGEYHPILKFIPSNIILDSDEGYWQYGDRENPVENLGKNLDFRGRFGYYGQTTSGLEINGVIGEIHQMEFLQNNYVNYKIESHDYLENKYIAVFMKQRINYKEDVNCSSTKIEFRDLEDWYLLSHRESISEFYFAYVDLEKKSIIKKELIGKWTYSSVTERKRAEFDEILGYPSTPMSTTEIREITGNRICGAICRFLKENKILLTYVKFSLKHNGEEKQNLDYFVTWKKPPGQPAYIAPIKEVEYIGTYLLWSMHNIKRYIHIIDNRGNLEKEIVIDAPAVNIDKNDIIIDSPLDPTKEEYHYGSVRIAIYNMAGTSTFSEPLSFATTGGLAIKLKNSYKDAIGMFILMKVQSSRYFTNRIYCYLIITNGFLAKNNELDYRFEYRSMNNTILASYNILGFIPNPDMCVEESNKIAEEFFNRKDLRFPIIFDFIQIP